METLRRRLQRYAPTFLRIGIGFVFALYAYHKLAVPEQGVVEIQGILKFVGNAAHPMNYYLGLAEAFVALSFFLGWQIRWSALLAGGMIAAFFGSIMLTSGLTNDPNLYRDAGLLGGTIALWLLGAGPLSLDLRRVRKAQATAAPTSVASQ